MFSRPSCLNIKFLVMANLAPCSEFKQEQIIKTILLYRTCQNEITLATL